MIQESVAPAEQASVMAQLEEEFKREEHELEAGLVELDSTKDELKLPVDTGPKASIE